MLLFYKGFSEPLKHRKGPPDCSSGPSSIVRVFGLCERVVSIQDPDKVQSAHQW